MMNYVFFLGLTGADIVSALAGVAALVVTLTPAGRGEGGPTRRSVIGSCRSPPESRSSFAPTFTS